MGWDGTGGSAITDFYHQSLSLAEWNIDSKQWFSCLPCNSTNGLNHHQMLIPEALSGDFANFCYNSFAYSIQESPGIMCLAARAGKRKTEFAIGKWPAEPPERVGAHNIHGGKYAYMLLWCVNQLWMLGNRRHGGKMSKWWFRRMKRRQSSMCVKRSKERRTERREQGGRDGDENDKCSYN